MKKLIVTLVYGILLVGNIPTISAAGSQVETMDTRMGKLELGALPVC